MEDGRQLAQGAIVEAQAAISNGRSLGDAVVSVGRGISTIARSVIEARENTDLMVADAAMKAGWARLKANLPEDPHGWGDMHKAAISEIRESVLGDPDKRRSRFLQRKLEENFRAFEAETAVSLETMAIAQHRNIARVQRDDAFAQAVERGDLQTAAEISAQSVASGLSTPELEEINMRKAVETVERQELGVMIETDPWRAEQALEEYDLPWMTPGDAVKARRAIKQAQHGKRIEEIQMLENALAESPDMGEMEFDVLVNMTHLEAADREKFRKAWREGSKPDFEAMAKLRGEVLKLTAESPIEDIWVMQERIVAEAHPNYRGQFMSLLGSAVSEKASDNTGRLFRQGSKLIESVVDKSKKYAPATLDELEFEKVKVVMESELEQWVAANPEADQGQMFKFLEGLGIEAVQPGGIDAVIAPGVMRPRQRSLLEEQNRKAYEDSVMPVDTGNWFSRMLSK